MLRGRPARSTSTASRWRVTLRNLFLASVQPLQSDKNYLVLVEPDTIG